MLLSRFCRSCLVIIGIILTLGVIAQTTVLLLPVTLNLIFNTLLLGPAGAVATALGWGFFAIYADAWEVSVSIALIGLVLGTVVKERMLLRAKFQNKVLSLYMQIKEFSVLRELNQTMQSTFDLNVIIKVILTGATAGKGLGFNRAMLFLLSEDEQLLEGKSAVGPDSGEEAFRIWESINLASMEEILEANMANRELTAGTPSKKDSKLRKTVSKARISLDGSSLLACVVRNEEMIHVTAGRPSPYPLDPVLQELKVDEFVATPLKMFDKVIGVVVVDNAFNREAIEEKDISALLELANQAAIAIGNAQSYQKQQQLAITDGLTNLYNHRYFQERFSAAVMERGQGVPLSLAIFDIDWFKKYNDTHGHKAGDRALRQLARILLDETRSQDIVCRYGGEEFAVLLRNTSYQQALEVAERIRQTIEGHPFKGEKLQPGGDLTCSIGVATAPEDGATVEALFHAADTALYCAKGQKNRVCGFRDIQIKEEVS